jgi:hypothetical protein
MTPDLGGAQAVRRGFAHARIAGRNAVRDVRARWDWFSPSIRAAARRTRIRIAKFPGSTPRRRRSPGHRRPRGGGSRSAIVQRRLPAAPNCP